MAAKAKQWALLMLTDPCSNERKTKGSGREGSTNTRDHSVQSRLHYHRYSAPCLYTSDCPDGRSFCLPAESKNFAVEEASLATTQTGTRKSTDRQTIGQTLDGRVIWRFKNDALVINLVHWADHKSVHFTPLDRDTQRPVLFPRIGTRYSTDMNQSRDTPNETTRRPTDRHRDR